MHAYIQIDRLIDTTLLCVSNTLAFRGSSTAIYLEQFESTEM